MPKTLIVAKSQLSLDLKKVLREAAYEAQITCKSDGADKEIRSALHRRIDEAAMKFAEKFADTAHKPMAEAIYNFVKEIGIVVTPMGTLISATPGSPVTGTVPMNNVKII